MVTWQRQVDRYAVLIHALATLALGWSLLTGINRMPAQWKDPDSLQLLSFIYPLWDACWNYGEYPVWNPYFGGGVPWAGYVYNPGLSIQSLLYLGVGPFVGIKLFALLVLFGGGLSLYAFARLWFALDPRFALVSSLLYMSALWLPYRMISGNFDEIILYVSPLAGVLMWGLLHGRWWGLLLPVLLQALFAQAKYGPFIVALLPFFCVLQWAGFSWLRVGRGMLLFGLAFLAGVVFSLPKLLPLVEMLARDLVDQTDFAGHKQYTPAHFFDYLIGHMNVMTGRTNAHMGVGAAAVVLAAVGLFAARGRAFVPAVLFGLSALLAMGDNSPLPLSRVLQAMPLFDTMRDYSKYWNQLPVVCVCLLAGLGLEVIAKALVRLGGWRSCRQACGVLMALGIGAMVVPNALPCSLYLYPRVFTADPVVGPREAFRQVAHRELYQRVDRYRRPGKLTREFNHDQYHLMMRGIGTVTWYGNLVFPECSIPQSFIQNGHMVPNPEYAGEAWFESPAGDREAAPGFGFTYNTLTASAKGADGRLLVFNFNYSPHWRTSAGQMWSKDGRLGVVLPSGFEGTVRLRYVDPAFRLGLAAMLAGLVAWFGGMPLLMRTWRRTMNEPEPDHGQGGAAPAASDAGPPSPIK